MSGIAGPVIRAMGNRMIRNEKKTTSKGIVASDINC